MYDEAVHHLIGESVSDPLIGIDPELLRRGMRQWASGVTVVTSVLAGERHGMTVNSFTSISLRHTVPFYGLRKCKLKNQCPLRL